MKELYILLESIKFFDTDKTSRFYDVENIAKVIHSIEAAVQLLLMCALLSFCEILNDTFW